MTARADIADRIAAELNGTPERVADYLNSGRAMSDLHELLRQRDEARRRALYLRAARIHAERRAARAQADLDALRARMNERDA